MSPAASLAEPGRALSQGAGFCTGCSGPGRALSSACFWSSSPQPPQPQVPETPWADEGGSVYHLTDEDFDQFLKEHSSVLVMFHAPCEWSLAPPHHLLPPLSIGGDALGCKSTERLLVGCLLSAGVLWCQARSLPSRYMQPILHPPQSQSGCTCPSAPPGRPEPLPPSQHESGNASGFPRIRGIRTGRAIRY